MSVNGRPSKYKQEYCLKLIKFMEEGYSFDAFAGEVDVDRSTIHRWKHEHPEFKEAYDVGSAKSQKVWEGIGISGAKGWIPNFSAASWIFNMKNRHGWRDKLEHSGAIATPTIIKKINGDTVTLGAELKEDE